MFSITDIFLIAIFGVTIVFYEMLSHGVLTMKMIQSIFSGNVNIYIIFAFAIFFFHKYLMWSGDNNLERTVLTLSNELQRMRTEAEWRNDAISQGRSCATGNYHVMHIYLSAPNCVLFFSSRIKPILFHKSRFHGTVFRIYGWIWNVLGRIYGSF